MVVGDEKGNEKNVMGMEFDGMSRKKSKLGLRNGIRISDHRICDCNGEICERKLGIETV